MKKASSLQARIKPRQNLSRGGAENHSGRFGRNYGALHHRIFGALPETNIAVRFHEKSAAVIGVTGRKQDVDKYGGILKKMTEILMLNIYYKQHFDLEERLRNHFLRECCTGTADNKLQA